MQFVASEDSLAAFFQRLGRLDFSRMSPLLFDTEDKDLVEKLEC